MPDKMSIIIDETERMPVSQEAADILGLSSLEDVPGGILTLCHVLGLKPELEPTAEGVRVRFIEKSEAIMGRRDEVGLEVRDILFRAFERLQSTTHIKAYLTLIANAATAPDNMLAMRETEHRAEPAVQEEPESDQETQEIVSDLTPEDGEKLHTMLEKIKARVRKSGRRTDSFDSKELEAVNVEILSSDGHAATDDFAFEHNGHTVTILMKENDLTEEEVETFQFGELKVGLMIKNAVPGHPDKNIYIAVWERDNVYHRAVFTPHEGISKAGQVKIVKEIMKTAMVELEKISPAMERAAATRRRETGRVDRSRI